MIWQLQIVIVISICDKGDQAPSLILHPTHDKTRLRGPRAKGPSVKGAKDKELRNKGQGPGAKGQGASDKG